MSTPRIEFVQGDITVEDVEAIVNAANRGLLGGGGVDGAIHAAAGPELLAECRRIIDTSLPSGLPVGQAVVTGAGRMKARYVIHTVGPNKHRGETDPALLRSCFTECLKSADAAECRSLAFPAISAGLYGWDVKDVAQIAVDAVRRFEPKNLELVRFVLFDAKAYSAFEAAGRSNPKAESQA